MPLTGRGGQFGGPRYGWGEVPSTPGARVGSGSAGLRTDFNSGLNDGRYTAGPEAGLRRGEWQWRGHGPSAQRGYGWDYQGGVGRDEIVMRTEARDGGGYLSHMAQDRGGGLPRYHDDYDAGDRWFPRLGERAGGRYGMDYDRGFHGGTGGRYDRGYMGRGGTLGGGGNRRRVAGGYGGEYRGGGYGGPMSRYGRHSGQGRAMGGGGGYGGDYSRPLSDAEFYSRVNRW